MKIVLIDEDGEESREYEIESTTPDSLSSIKDKIIGFNRQSTKVKINIKGKLQEGK